MRSPSTPSLRHSPPPHLSPAAPLFAWLVVQLLALSLGVFRVPLAARVTQPEQFSLHVMLVTQVMMASLLFPFILRDATTSAMAILSIVPFIQLTSYLSGVSLGRGSLAGAYVAMWMLALAVWRPTLQTRRGEMLAVACAVALSVCGAIVWYVRAEGGEAGSFDWRIDALLSPIVGSIAQIHAPMSAALAAWTLPIIALIACAIARVSYRALRDR